MIFLAQFVKCVRKEAENLFEKRKKERHKTVLLMTPIFKF